MNIVFSNVVSRVIVFFHFYVNSFVLVEYYEIEVVSSLNIVWYYKIYFVLMSNFNNSPVVIVDSRVIIHYCKYQVALYKVCHEPNDYAVNVNSHQVFVAYINIFVNSSYL